MKLTSAIAIAFSMLAADAADWSSSEWIRAVSGDGGDSSVFKKTFVNRKPVLRARWTVTGLGVFEARVNGAEVGDFLKPGFTHTGKCRHSFSYDVTRSMRRGKGDENELSATVSGGWWRDWIVSNGRRDMLPVDDQSEPDGLNPNSPDSSAESAFRGELELEYADGSRETVGTDSSWLAAKGGPVRKANIYDGETYDARATNVVWGKAERYDYFKGEIRPLVGPPVCLREDLTLAPLSICVVQGVANETEDAYGVARIVRGYADGDVVKVMPGETLVVDFGQNCAAVPRFDLEGPEGAVMTVRMSEMLNEGGGLKSRGNDGPDGTPYLAALRGIFAGVKYTFREGRQGYQPTHSFFGYRYAGITATRPIRILSMRSVPVTSISREAETGFIETGDKAVNQLISNVRWGHYSNYLSVPTDCPQRNERLGWTGDTQVFCPAAMYNADVLGFLRKWLADCRDTQLEDGSYLSVAPLGVAGRSGPMSGWADAGIVVPYRLWRTYGDTQVIEEGWDSMVRYMDRIERTDGPDLHRVGDHLSYELNDMNVKRYLSACYYVSDSAQMAQMAAAIGRESDRDRFLAMERKARRLFSERFLDGSGEIREECRCQTTALFALSLGLVSGKAVEGTKAYLVENLRSHGNRLQTGFLGTGIIMDTLSEAGLTELAYTLLLQHEEPSWLYSVDQGATTIWERWNGYTKAKGFGPVSMNSFNHYAYGAVLSWLYSVSAGIRLHESVNAFRRFVLAPEPDRRLGRVTARYRSASGTIESAWEYAPDGNWTWRFTVPAGTEAEVRLGWAGRKPQVFGPGSHEITVERDVIYALGSLTKPFTAALALTYVDEGRIGLDDNVGDFLPAVTNGCTLRQLLSCTSGYALRHCMYPLDRISVADLVEKYSGAMCETVPGTVYNYGPWGFYIAAALVEKLSGKPFEEAMAERILRPLGTKDATFFPTQSQLDRLDASALGLMYFTYPLTDGARRAVPDFGLFASEGDVRKFGEMLLAGGVSGGRRILSERSAGEFFRKQTPECVDRRYSFGCNVDELSGLIWCSSATRMHMSVSRKTRKAEVVPPASR